MPDRLADGGSGGAQPVGDHDFVLERGAGNQLSSLDHFLDVPDDL
jgi:hypothetical protein